ncbi:MAG: hypothetical protein ACXVZM_14965 [Terriglobales bacterium]
MIRFGLCTDTGTGRVTGREMMARGVGATSGRCSALACCISRGSTLTAAFRTERPWAKSSCRIAVAPRV